MSFLLITCPTCEILIEVYEVAHAEFRCGVYKVTGEPLPSHASRAVCETAFRTGQIYGCGGAFHLVNGYAIACDYK